MDLNDQTYKRLILNATKVQDGLRQDTTKTDEVSWLQEIIDYLKKLTTFKVKNNVYSTDEWSVSDFTEEEERKAPKDVPFSPIQCITRLDCIKLMVSSIFIRLLLYHYSESDFPPKEPSFATWRINIIYFT
ncbi:hypothetical protein ACOME3_003322 [Neoechinorhynchus agilis]